METWAILILILVVAILVQWYLIDLRYWFWSMLGYDEGFGSGGGALQSLYSNDGPQDIYLTVNNDNTGSNDWSWGGLWGGYGWGYNPYRYWRGMPWYLPTRNLSRVSYYPYLYDYNVDRYGRFYPYW